MRSHYGRNGPGKSRFRGHDAGVDPVGGMAPSTRCGVGGNGDTGVYWIAPHEVLEGRGLEVLLVDTRQLARVPGRERKRIPTTASGLNGCIAADYCGGSFRPAEQVCMLRTLERDKTNLVAESGDWVRRMQKSLDQMNVRVHRAVSDIDGVTGMAILRAIADGERDARKLAQLRDPRCRKSEPEIAEQLSGLWRKDHLFTLRHTENVRRHSATDRRVRPKSS